MSGSRRAALVTGAASGIGRAIAARLEADDWDVLAVDLEPDTDGPGEPFAADLTTREANRASVAAALDRFGRLDAVVPNAGFQHIAPVEAFPEDVWEELIALLLTSPFLLARYAWPALRASADGRIVVVASVHGLVASRFKSAYVSAKHGVLGLVKTLALEGAEVGIAVSAVCPGYVRTPLVESQINAQARAHGIAEERVVEDVLLTQQAIKELLEPKEVADAVAFLLGPTGRFATGSPLVVDGGWSAR
jgi:3-hydroxybutyrate dehydrogenase